MAQPKQPIRRKVGRRGDKSHSKGFDAALEAAIDAADGEWGPGMTPATVTLEVTVETQSPGVIHEYIVTLTP